MAGQRWWAWEDAGSTAPALLTSLDYVLDSLVLWDCTVHTVPDGTILCPWYATYYCIQPKSPRALALRRATMRGTGTTARTVQCCTAVQRYSTYSLSLHH